MKNPSIICADILIASVQLAILGETESALELTSLLWMKILKGSFKKQVDDRIFQHAMNWMIYLELKEQSDLKDKSLEEILALFEQIKQSLT